MTNNLQRISMFAVCPPKGVFWVCLSYRFQAKQATQTLGWVLARRAPSTIALLFPLHPGTVSGHLLWPNTWKGSTKIIANTYSVAYRVPGIVLRSYVQ